MTTTNEIAAKFEANEKARLEAIKAPHYRALEEAKAKLPDYRTALAEANKARDEVFAHPWDKLGAFPTSLFSSLFADLDRLAGVEQSTKDGEKILNEATLAYFENGNRFGSELDKMRITEFNDAVATRLGAVDGAASSLRQLAKRIRFTLKTVLESISNRHGDVPATLTTAPRQPGNSIHVQVDSAFDARKG